jgi:hypothetical protein
MHAQSSAVSIVCAYTLKPLWLVSGCSAPVIAVAVVTAAAVAAAAVSLVGSMTLNARAHLPSICKAPITVQYSSIHVNKLFELSYHDALV